MNNDFKDIQNRLNYNEDDHDCWVAEISVKLDFTDKYSLDI